ncbi:ABC transporter substrate-binding protein [Vibrio ziniensis]|uniref:ABC transporter substrate-binding protein n=1 Tax=Vibrio ziniensis TaxID=2711221 RepID=A0A6G7CQ47_9VIBR|nr:ABC transporter substrate-binding protein [Vibrio ziniensis]QIH44267.1 ABC transporter substrate-binding protein [Vibrio ziniensis]
MKVRTIVLTFLITLSSVSVAEDIYHIENPNPLGSKQTQLKIYGAADFDAIQPIFEGYLRENPNLTILYKEFSTRELDYYVKSTGDWPDVLMSPAMDLQIKLVNDGFAKEYESSNISQLPEWAAWRDEVFAFTYEPVAIAINNNVLGNFPLPTNRKELLDLIRDKGDTFDGKIGLLDMDTVGLGYLTWAYDSQQSRMYGRLLEVFGARSAKLYPNSTSMLQALANGEIYVAYNVLGSYASKWAEVNSQLSVILPSDYTSVILRSALVPKKAQRPNQGFAFIDYLLSDKGQTILANQSSLIPVRIAPSSSSAINKLRRSKHSPLIPITFGLPLILLTDQAKRSLLLKEWDNSLKL